MMTREEACRALIAARKLAALYDAYTATSQAGRIIIERFDKAIARRPKRPDETALLDRYRRLHEQAALSRQAQAVYEVRAAQVRRRIRELQTWSEDS